MPGGNHPSHSLPGLPLGLAHWLRASSLVAAAAGRVGTYERPGELASTAAGTERTAGPAHCTVDGSVSPAPSALDAARNHLTGPTDLRCSRLCRNDRERAYGRSSTRCVGQA